MNQLTLNQWMMLKGVKTPELAKKANISISAINKWRSGKALPTFENLIKVSAALEIKIDEIAI